MKKKMYRILALICVCVMMVCSFSFATSSTAYYRGQTVNYSCTASSTTATAETCYPTVGMERYASITATYRRQLDGSTTAYTTGDSMSSYTGDVSASCSYSGAVTVTASSSHSVESWSGGLNDYWP